jgi:hypothetical protein
VLLLEAQPRPAAQGCVVLHGWLNVAYAVHCMLSTSQVCPTAQPAIVAQELPTAGGDAHVPQAAPDSMAQKPPEH